jgi:hypothetical protein
MGVFSQIEKVEKGFAWGFTGVLLAVVFGGMAIYTEFFRRTAPQVEFELIGNTPVLDVREKVPELEVMYRGQDIAKLGQTLSVLLVRVTNQGSAVLVSNHYEPKFPLGIALSGGTLIRGELSGASNDYLSKAMKVHVRGPGAAELEPVIIEPGEWYVVKLLALHRARSQPSVSSTGKIAGQHSVRVTALPTAADSDGVWHRAFSGDWWAQLIRILAYGVAGIIVLGASIAGLITASEYRDKWRRRRLVARFKGGRSLPLTEKDEYVFKHYLDLGPHVVLAWKKAVLTSARLNRMVNQHFALKAAERKWRKERMMSDPMLEHRRFSSRWSFEIDLLLEAKVLSQLEGRWVIDPERKQLIEDFAAFLTTHSSEAAETRMTHVFAGGTVAPESEEEEEAKAKAKAEAEAEAKESEKGAKQP